MHTKDRLAAAMRECGVPEDMVKKAEAGYYDDYLSPLPDNITQLLADLAAVAKAAGDNSKLAFDCGRLAGRAVQGEFDGTKEESEAWAMSEEGQEAFRKLSGRS